MASIGDPACNRLLFYNVITAPEHPTLLILGDLKDWAEPFDQAGWRVVQAGAAQAVDPAWASRHTGLVDGVIMPSTAPAQRICRIYSPRWWLALNRPGTVFRPCDYGGWLRAGESSGTNPEKDASSALLQVGGRFAIPRAKQVQASTVHWDGTPPRGFLRAFFAANAAEV